MPERMPRLPAEMPDDLSGLVTVDFDDATLGRFVTQSRLLALREMLDRDVDESCPAAAALIGFIFRFLSQGVGTGLDLAVLAETDPQIEAALAETGGSDFGTWPAWMRAGVRLQAYVQHHLLARPGTRLGSDPPSVDDMCEFALTACMVGWVHSGGSPDVQVPEEAILLGAAEVVNAMAQRRLADLNRN